MIHPEFGDLDRYRVEVSAELQRRYGITWSDACGNDQPLVRGREAGRTPAEFVEWWGEKYQLVERAVRSAARGNV